MYCIAGFRKVKDFGKISMMFGHNFRTRDFQNCVSRIDKTKTKDNVTYINEFNATNAPSFTKQLKKYFDDKNAQIRRNSVLAIDLMLTASPEFFQNKSKNEVEQWAKTQIEFVKSEFPANVKYAVLHVDETTPHIHFLITTDVTKDVTYKNQTGSITKTVTSLKADRYSPEFWRGFLARFEKANSKYGLSKGVENSEAKNVSLKEFKSAISTAKNVNYMKKVNEIIEKSADSLNIIATKNQIKAALKQTIGVELNNVLKQHKLVKTIVSCDRKKEYAAIAKKKQLIDEKLKAIEKMEQETAKKAAEYANLHKKALDEILKATNYSPEYITKKAEFENRLAEMKQKQQLFVDETNATNTTSNKPRFKP